MKSPYFLAFLALAANASAAIYTTDFSTMPGVFGSDVNGKQGWSVNDLTDQYSIVANWNGSRAVGLGDAAAVDAVPTVPKVTLSHGIAATVGATSVSFDFAIFDSYFYNPDPGNVPTKSLFNRDQFGITLGGGSDELSVFFVPEDPTPTDPEDPSENGGLGGKWLTYYSLNGGPSVALNLAIFEGSSYEFMLNLVPNANPLLTDLSLMISSGANSLDDEALGISMDSAGGFLDFSLFWAQNGSNAYGSNIVLMDNLSVVPEPSAPLLFGFAALGLMTRRKRA